MVPFGRTVYKRPPAATKFKQGVSGNPKGRPKAQMDVHSLFLRELGKRLRIREEGQVKTLTKLELIVKRQINKAIEGNPKSVALVMDIRAEAEAEVPQRERIISVISDHYMRAWLDQLSDKELDEVISSCKERAANPESASR